MPCCRFEEVEVVEKASIDEAFLQLKPRQPGGTDRPLDDHSREVAASIRAAGEHDAASARFKGTCRASKERSWPLTNCPLLLERVCCPRLLTPALDGDSELAHSSCRPRCSEAGPWAGLLGGHRAQ